MYYFEFNQNIRSLIFKLHLSKFENQRYKKVGKECKKEKKEVKG